MESLGKWFMAWTALVGVLVIAGIGIAATTYTSDTESLRHTRACEIEAGSGWTEVDCSAAAAYSAVLTKNTRYILQAVTGSPYLAITTAGSGQDADSSDGYLPVGEWLLIRTPDSDRYISCDGSADSGTIRYVECQ